MATSDGLTVSSLVTLEQDVVPYALDWPGADLDGSSEVAMLVAKTRPGGLLAVLPLGFIPEEILAVGNTPSPPGMVGPSCAVIVPSGVLEGGMVSETGEEISVLVVDLGESVVLQMRSLADQEVPLFSYDPEQQFAFPVPEPLLRKVQEWVAGGGETSALGFYSAASIDGEAMSAAELEDAMSPAQQPPRRRRATVPGQEPRMPAVRKPTVASLAGSLEQILHTSLGMQKQ